jgi:hypothetical protein
LCGWHDAHGPRISGFFRLEGDSYQSIENWSGTESVVDRFGVFGKDPDGSMYSVWRQDDGRCPIVQMGSEGQNNFVLAGDMIDFIRLLAVGYDEIRLADLASPGTPEYVNKPFRAWVSQMFHVPIPETGIEIVAPARAAHEDFQAWIDDVIDTAEW